MKQHQERRLAAMISAVLIGASITSFSATEVSAQETYPDGIHFHDDEVVAIDRLDDYVIEDELVDQYSNDNDSNETTGSHTKTLVSSTDLIDSDDDGIPDEWELNGFVNAQGELFPLNEWGADPHRPDIFLQINWMKPDPYVGQKDMYAPAPSSLDKLVDLFDKNGYNLHIDAGDVYNNIPNIKTYGGETIRFDNVYIKNENYAGLFLEQQRVDQLKDRSGLFHSGTIVKQVNYNRNGGLGVVNGGSFTVQSLPDKYLHHIILHELGHNIGLSHHGHVGKTRVSEPLNGAFLPNYKSEMNYIYSYDYFDYSHEATHSSDTLPAECLYTRLRCFTGSYEVPSDWDYIDLKNLFIGRFNGKTAEPLEVVSPVDNTQSLEFEKKDNENTPEVNENVKIDDDNDLDIPDNTIDDSNSKEVKVSTTTTEETKPQENTSTHTVEKKEVHSTSVVTSEKDSSNTESNSYNIAIKWLDEDKVQESKKEVEDNSKTNGITEVFNSEDIQDKEINSDSKSSNSKTQMNPSSDDTSSNSDDIVKNVLIALVTALSVIGIIGVVGYFISGFM